MIGFRSNILTDSLFGQKNVPCLCKIAKDFYIEFINPIPSAEGIVLEWDRNEIVKRVPAGVGGKYTHYCCGLITINRINNDIYDISDLSMFVSDGGWKIIVSDRNYTIGP